MNTKGLEEFIKFMRGHSEDRSGGGWEKKLKSDLISKLGGKKRKKKKSPFHVLALHNLSSASLIFIKTKGK